MIRLNRAFEIQSFPSIHKELSISDDIADYVSEQITDEIIGDWEDYVCRLRAIFSVSIFFFEPC
jgi:predicted nucleic acid-binding OB-fold protein